MPESIVRLVFVGGPAGAGKTTVLSAQERQGHVFLSSGSLFKEAMKLHDRDKIRTVDWTEFQRPVTDRLTSMIAAMTPDPGVTAVVIDTHFAAKVSGRSYRIGLEQDLIGQIATTFLEVARANARRPRVDVVLVTLDSRLLLQRRRNDRSRVRELLPSDCVIGIKENLRFSKHYFGACIAAEVAQLGGVHGLAAYHQIENRELARAQSKFAAILGVDT